VARFVEALTRGGLTAIAEFKRRSPSAGDIRPDAEPAASARAYESGGAAAMSVLVDERFGGSVHDLRAARAATGIPLLAKGFFSTEGELRALREAGADGVLLLLRDLDDATTSRLMAHARDLGLDALVEAHDAQELERAVRLGADPIGLNARDLGTLRIDRDAQLELVADAPRDRVVVAESGIQSRAQAALAELAGADAILVGTSLMRADDPAEKLRDLLARPLVKVCGLTRQADVEVAVEAGADLLGFILAAESPRRAPRLLDVPDTVASVGVYVGEAGDDGADLVQLYRRENGHRSRDGLLLRGGKPVADVLDLPWKEDDPSHWERAASWERRVMLAGRLAADNVREAIRRVRPWAVDAASRLEREPGVKDHDAVRAYVQAARWR
jgi:indole-3-glycerol phosphate synthase/phosphoribosylanthranilate isomerase